ncbi:MAG: L,D-transpeptidase family protein [Methylococcales bacterium]|nr:L,D-transpeptidase family protein [Methylococcales bacterium]
MYFPRHSFKSARLLLSACLLLYVFSQQASADSRDAGIRQAITALLASGQLPLLQQPDFSGHGKELAQLYRNKHLLWLGEGRPEKNLHDALDMLANAELDALNPLDYDAARLRDLSSQLATEQAADYKTLAGFDVALSVSVLRFIHDLHVGRVDPHSFNYPPQFGSRHAINAAALLKQYLEGQNLPELPLAAAPGLKQYQMLKQALADFRRQAADNAPRGKIQFAKALHPGESDPQIPELRRRLSEMGELAAGDGTGPDSVENDSLYNEVLVAAIIHLQQEQGLQADGVIGRQTLSLLNMTPADKIALIELAMERLRWLPEPPAGPQIMVNIPAFQLWALNSPDDENALSMKVVVGKAPENQTPILSDNMRYLEFMPYWNIPKSILDKEILPKIRTGQNSFSSQEIELVQRFADETGDETDNIIDDLKHGRVRARQLPGKKNPLGKVKFIFPNKDDVYMHDTPFRSGFNRDRRDLSHGCVRVAEAGRLAEFVLGEQTGWDKKAIDDAMAAPKTHRVSLKKTIPVLFFYSTAYPGRDSKLRFYPDIYGYDVLLQDALKKNPARQVSSKNTVTNG